MELVCKPVIISRKNLDVSNRIDPQFFDEEFTLVENALKTKPHFILNDLIKFRAIKGDSSRRFKPSSDPEKTFFYIDIANTNKKDGSIYPQEIACVDASPRARKIVKTNDLILSTVRPNKNAVAIIYPEYDDYVCSTGFALFETINIDPKLLFVFLKTKYSVIQLIRRTRATMYPAVNPDIDVPQIIVPKCILKEKETIIRLINESIKHLQEWSLKLNLIDNKIAEKFKSSSFHIPTTYEKPTIVNKEKLMNYANRCDAEFFEFLFEKLYTFLDGYELVPLSDLIDDIFTGKTPEAKAYTENEEDPAIIKVGTLSNKGLNWDDVEFIPKTFLNSNKKYIIKENDIVMTSSAHSSEHIAKKIDVVGEIPEEYKNRCITVGELMTIRLKETCKIDPHYIASFLRTIFGKLQLQRCIRGITSHIYPQDLLKFIKIPISEDKFMKKISQLVKESENERNKGRKSFFEAKKIMEQEIKKNLK
tara:strand:+ start:514 stop:1944 length:1431 start_codon:yes stop_codon:yes gene_type:complete